MKKGGLGGANTLTGLNFEKKSICINYWKKYQDIH